VKKVKVLLFLTLLITFQILITTPVYANSKNITLDSISQKYNLKDVDTTNLPEGIKPIEFKSYQELAAFLEKVKRQNDIEEEKVKKLIADRKIKNLLVGSSLTQAIDTNLASNNIGSQTKLVSSSGTFSYYMSVSYYYSYNYTFNKNVFTGCRSIYTFISGFSPFVDYQQYDSWYSILDSGRTLACTAKGITSYYIFIEGVLKVYQYDKTLYGEFYNP